MPLIMPDYMLVFSIAVLAHHPEFESINDVEMLKRLRAALWFVMEPLMVKNDNFSFGFYKALVEKIKNYVDVMDDQDNFNSVSKNCQFWVKTEEFQVKTVKFHAIHWVKTVNFWEKNGEFHVKTVFQVKTGKFRLNKVEFQVKEVKL